MPCMIRSTLSTTAPITLSLGCRQRFFERLQRRRLTKALKVSDLAADETMINPELLPKARLSACAVDARRKVERCLSSENGLSRHTGDRRHPGKGSALVEPPRGTLLADLMPDHQPLVECEPVHYDEGRPTAAIALRGEKTCDVVHHHRRRGRQAVEAAEPPLQPLTETGVDLRSNAGDSRGHVQIGSVHRSRKPGD